MLKAGGREHTLRRYILALYFGINAIYFLAAQIGQQGAQGSGPYPPSSAIGPDIDGNIDHPSVQLFGICNQLKPQKTDPLCLVDPEYR